MPRTSGGPLAEGIASAKRLWSRNRIAVILFGCFFFGALYGSILVARAEGSLNERLISLAGEYLSARREQTLLESFLLGLGAYALPLLAGFLLGFFALGQPVCLFLMLFHGFGLGVAMGELYAACRLEGVVYCAVLVAPAAVLFTFLLAAALRDAIRMSNLFLGVLLPRFGAAATAPAVRIYLLHYALYLLLALAVAALGAVLNLLFGGLAAPAEVVSKL